MLMSQSEVLAVGSPRTSEKSKQEEGRGIIEDGMRWCNYLQQGGITEGKMQAGCGGMTVSSAIVKPWSNPLVLLDQCCCSGQQRTLLKDKKLSVKEKLCRTKVLCLLSDLYSQPSLVPSLSCGRCVQQPRKRGVRSWLPPLEQFI